MLTYENSQIILIGRVTKDLTQLVKTNAQGMKFVYFDMALQRGFGTEQTTFVNGLYLSGIRNTDGTYNNVNVDNFINKVTPKHLVLLELHFEGYKKTEDGNNRYVEVKKMDSFRILSFPRNEESDVPQFSPEDLM